MNDPLIEAKSLVLQAGDARSNQAAIDNLIMAVTLLIGLVEGHRHSYIGQSNVWFTSPMQVKSVWMS